MELSDWLPLSINTIPLLPLEQRLQHPAVQCGQRRTGVADYAVSNLSRIHARPILPQRVYRPPQYDLKYNLCYSLIQGAVVQGLLV